MDPHLLALAERQAPRFTSYPSAPHFGPEVDARLYHTWLGELPADAELSIYLHVPYCRQLCWYCGCNTWAWRRDDATDFVTTLLAEIGLVAHAAGGHKVGEIHWGGGTPNILSPDEFKRIVHELDFWFDLDQGLSHGIEIDPRYLTTELAETYASVGVTRASLGVQDLNLHVQQGIGRVQPFAVVRQAVADLRHAGIDQLSFDLMYGLPEQSADDLLRSLRQAASLAPNRIALFGYAHVPWFKRRQRLINEHALPDTQARFDQAKAAHTELTQLGYVAVGLDHFAKPDDILARAARAGSLRRNFQGYVAKMPDAILGLGPSAISTLPQGYAQNINGVGAWRGAVESGHLPIARGHEQSADDRRRAALIEAIMCDFQADLADFGGRAAFAKEIAALTPLVSDGVVVIDGGRLFLPEPMHPFCRLVAQAFDAYGGDGGAKHSRAI
jgi:oxygen-independent coproporphyrinogen-3 oxidase